MIDYLKYYVAPLTQILTAIGLYLGGPWVWIGIGFFPAMAILDALLPRDYGKRNMHNRALANIPVWMSTVLGPAIFLVMAWSVAHNNFTTLELFGAGLSCLWMSVMPLVPAAHELYHARGALGKTVARYSQVVFLDCTRLEAHVAGHHIDVATPTDTDTARRGQGMYSFALRAVIDSTIQAQQLECNALEKRGLSRWSIRHKLWRAILAQLAFQAIVFAIGGWTAVAVSIGAVLGARYIVENFNYFQHYGLIRLPGAPIQRHHVWNHLGTMSRLIGFEITNHADHHLNSYAAYYELVPDRQAIAMPSVFTCYMAALVPPIWFHWIIKPALKRWDNEFAGADERRIAAQHNRDADWEPWVKEAPIRATA
jgi:p-cymene methyl-monooxygenase